MGQNARAQAGKQAPWTWQRKFRRVYQSVLSLPKYVDYTFVDIRVYNNDLGLKVDGELWDLERPLEKSCLLELLDFEHPEGVLNSPRSIDTLTSSRRKESLLAFIRPCPW